MGVKRVRCQAQADLARMSVAQGGQEGTCELRLEGLARRVSQRWEQHSVQSCWSSKWEGLRCQVQGLGSVQGVLGSHRRAVGRGGAGQLGGPVAVDGCGPPEAEARGEAAMRAPGEKTRPKPGP